MKLKTKSLYTIFLLAVVSSILCVYFNLIAKPELALNIIVSLMMSSLLSFGFISEESTYFKNFVYFLSFGILTFNSRIIFDLLF
ncbi:hypothetical protein [Tenacibaculum sp. 190524A05c]|uniref:hypothetical protein n=1 Tax=Tenacibaculum platacis TaxID=3137852 RepID=UPI0031FB8326